MEERLGNCKAAVEHFIALAADRFDAAGQSLPAAAEAAELLRTSPITATGHDPGWPPACRHWEALLSLAKSQGQGDLAEALRPLGGALGWTSGSDFYGPATARWGDKLAYADVVGPYGGLYTAPGYHLGPIIFAPGMDYPSHNHPAAEIYYLVAGEGDWQRGGEGWTARKPGDLIHHPPGIPHATRTGASPALALVCLTGEVDAPPVLL